MRSEKTAKPGWGSAGIFWKVFFFFNLSRVQELPKKQADVSKGRKIWRSKALKLVSFCHEAGNKQPASFMQPVFLVSHTAVQPYNKVMVGVGWTLS